MLELHQALPASVIPLKLKTCSLNEETVWQAFGCPGEDGYWSRGTFRPPDFRYRRQLIPNSEDPPVQKGFSGTPVFLDAQGDEFVGMVVAIYPQHQNRAAFMLPIEILTKAVRQADVNALAAYLESAGMPWQRILDIYRQCLPKTGWEEATPDNLRDLLLDLAENVPDIDDSTGRYVSALSLFVAGLIVSQDLNTEPKTQLRRWLQLKVDDVPGGFWTLCGNDVILEGGRVQRLRCLVHLEQSQKDDLKKFRVKAWFNS